MSYILSENINLIDVYNVCMRKCMKWDENRNLCDTLRQKKMCYTIQKKIIMLVEANKSYVDIIDDSENIEPLSQKKCY